jgi:hypothetical protein
MDAQTVFYTLGSVFMILGILFLIAMVVGLIYLIKTIKTLQETVIEKIDSVKQSITEPARVARGVGSAAAGAVAFGLKQFMSRKK